MHAWVLLAALSEVLDQLLRAYPLTVEVVGPPPVVHPVSALLREQTEQEEQAGVGAPERVALVVEDHVAIVGRGQGAQPQCKFLRAAGGEQFERRQLVGCVASPHLQRSLLRQQCLAFRVQTGDWPIDFRQYGHRQHVVCFQRRRLGRTDAGDELQRVCRTPLGLA
ncbi:unannotated protein [freshwater metagenome]|uniref:Unannotated protein n=1 Tax=freshwater metagenome TaxID=449393 RepID=A0A6J6ZRW8_9ZZZZ